MFRKLFIFALIATCAGYAFADNPPATGDMPMPTAQMPVWPATGDAAYFAPIENMDAGAVAPTDNVRVVSKIGDDVIVNNGGAQNPSNPNTESESVVFSGGADLTHGGVAPAGFNMYEANAKMPLMHAEMMEDDGGSVLAASRSGRAAEMSMPSRMQMQYVSDATTDSDSGFNDNDQNANFDVINNSDSGSVSGSVSDSDVANTTNPNAESESDSVKSWVVASGSTLHDILQDWCDKEGWDLVWTTASEYPVEASAVFKGRFMDVASALVRNFSRATPAPYAKFYKGNRVIVVSTNTQQ